MVFYLQILLFKLLIMAVEKINIEIFLELSKQYPVIDVRSPGEFNHAQIPGAHSLPLFNDEERKIVGITYKQQTREAAIKIGLDFFGVKMKQMVEDVEGIVASYKLAVTSNQNPATGNRQPATGNCSHSLLAWRYA